MGIINKILTAPSELEQMRYRRINNEIAEAIDKAESMGFDIPRYLLFLDDKKDNYLALQNLRDKIKQFTDGTDRSI